MRGSCGVFGGCAGRGDNGGAEWAGTLGKRQGTGGGKGMSGGWKGRVGGAGRGVGCGGALGRVIESTQLAVRQRLADVHK